MNFNIHPSMQVFYQQYTSNTFFFFSNWGSFHNLKITSTAKPNCAMVSNSPGTKSRAVPLRSVQWVHTKGGLLLWWVSPLVGALTLQSGRYYPLHMHPIWLGLRTHKNWKCTRPIVLSLISFFIKKKFMGSMRKTVRITAITNLDFD